MGIEPAWVVASGGGITGCGVAYHLALAGWTVRHARRPLDVPVGSLGFR